jgi:hypothetical protein
VAVITIINTAQRKRGESERSERCRAALIGIRDTPYGGLIRVAYMIYPFRNLCQNSKGPPGAPVNVL